MANAKKVAKERVKRTFFQKIRRLCLWLIIITLPVILGVVASSPWWMPIAVEHLVADQLKKAGIEDADFKVSNMSLSHIELSEFSGQWQMVRFEIGRIEAQFTIEELRDGKLQQIGIHNASLVFEHADEDSSAGLLEAIAKIPANSFFIRESTISWETYSTREPTRFSTECIFERGTQDGSRFWTRLESGRHFLEVSGNESPAGDREINFDLLLNMPLIQTLAPVTLPTIPFMQGMKWSDLQTRRGRLKAEGRVEMSGGTVESWALLSNLTNLQFDRTDGEASANINIGARGRGMAFSELLLKASGKTQNTSPPPTGDILQQGPHDRHRLEYEWDAQVEMKDGSLAGQIQLGFENSTLLLDTAAPRLRIYGISGATDWLLQGTTLSSKPTTLLFTQAELPGVTMRSGELTLPETIDLNNPVANATLASSVSFQQQGTLEDRIVDGEVELSVRLHINSLFPAAGRAFNTLKALPKAE